MHCCKSLLHHWRQPREKLCNYRHEKSKAIFIVSTTFQETTLEIKLGCLGACALPTADFPIPLILWGNKMDSRSLVPFLEGRPCKGCMEAVTLYSTVALLGSTCPPPYYLDPSLVAAYLTCQIIILQCLGMDFKVSGIQSRWGSVWEMGSFPYPWLLRHFWNSDAWNKSCGK